MGQDGIVKGYPRTSSEHSSRHRPFSTRVCWSSLFAQSVAQLSGILRLLTETVERTALPNSSGPAGSGGSGGRPGVWALGAPGRFYRQLPESFIRSALVEPQSPPDFRHRGQMLCTLPSPSPLRLSQMPPLRWRVTRSDSVRERLPLTSRISDLRA